MSRIRLLNFNKEIEINLDKRIDLSQAFIAATYNQLVIGSKTILTIYDLSSILVNEEFSNKYDVITIPNDILALTSTIDKILYVYCSKENLEELKICSLLSSNEEENLIIESFDIKTPIHLCSLDDGTIYLGYDKKIYSLKTNPWSFDTKIKKLSSGKEHVLVLLDDGRLFSWGNGLHGALGHGDLEPCIEPTYIEVLDHDVNDIAAGGWHSLALLSDGSVMSWGWNNDGSLGLNSTDTDDISGVFCDPTLVTCLPIGIDCKQISAGARHSAFIGTNDYVWLYGSNKHGQLGDKTSFIIEKKTFISCLSWFTFLIS